MGGRGNADPQNVDDLPFYFFEPFPKCLVPSAVRVFLINFSVAISLMEGKNEFPMEKEHFLYNLLYPFCLKFL